MPFHIVSSNLPPKENSLIVCAGTITCLRVDAMGAGFLAFKKFFNEDHYLDAKGSWRSKLNEVLNSYHELKEEMPAYLRIATQNSYLGGIATVPVNHSKGLTFKKFANHEEQEKEFKEQYKNAVRQAVEDAKALARPLYIQPLGIGVYGWDPANAAKLFAEAIMTADPNDKIDITIPIFDLSPGSKDKQFAEAFMQIMKKNK